jgi:1,4-dihydroxy-6-naphthoate synthase
VPVPGVEVVEQLEDVETLNRRALGGELDLTKVSFHAFAHFRDRYCLLRSGAALGRGCGPLVAAREETSMDALRGRRIAIPGRYTTAHLLLMLYGAGYEDVSVMPFEQVMPAVERGDADAGLIIHEGRFTYKLHGLKKVLDLGEWWETETGLPIPLGCIIAKRALGPGTVSAVESGIRASIEYAYSHRDETRSYIKSNAQEMDDSVIDSHIGLYVNDFSLDLGEEGVRAITELFRRATARGIVPDTRTPLFL